MTNTSSLAIMPVGGECLVPAGHGHNGDSAWADWKVGAYDWKCRLTAEGLQTILSGAGRVAVSLPAFEFDGENATEVVCDGRTLKVAYRGWVCTYSTDGEIVDTGRICCNRNGRYRAFEARGENSLTVWIDIRKSALAKIERK